MPEDVSDDLRFFAQSAPQAVSTADYAASEGFDISTRFDEILDGDVDATATADETGPDDEYVATLSEGEADAWQPALRSRPPERNDAGQLIDPETGEVVQGRGVNGGCIATAQSRCAETSLRSLNSAMHSRSSMNGSSLTHESPRSVANGSIA